jgi:hypothetical protein
MNIRTIYRKLFHPEALNYRMLQVTKGEKGIRELSIYSGNNFHYVYHNYLELSKKNPQNCYFIFDQLANQIITTDMMQM